jgi:hypothetical protein
MHAWNGSQIVAVPKPGATSPPNWPAARTTAAMAPDGRGQLLMYGGVVNTVPSGETWRFDGTRWARLAEPTVSPANDVQRGVASAFDSDRDRVVHVNGYNTNGDSLVETWELTRDGWQFRQIGGNHPVVANACMAYDPVRHESVLFGGLDAGSNTSNDTWTWNGTAWTKKPVVGALPLARHACAMAFDPQSQKILLFGGPDPSVLADRDTYAWDGTSWTKLDTTTKPPARQYAGMATDLKRGTVVMLGGFLAGANLYDAWVFHDGDWHQVADGPNLFFPRLAWNATLQTLFAVGGNGYIDSYSFDGTAWTRVAPSSVPPSRTDISMQPTLDGTGVLLFGGTPSSEAWTLRYEVPNTDREEVCRLATDLDGDSLSGCMDPDCALDCAGCGDTTCDPARETHALCPVDCL